MLAAAIKEGHDTDAVALVVFVALFAFVTVLGFVAARWRRAKLDHLDEWGLGGRRFGTVVTWFLLGGDLYTAYTFIAVPALVFGVGAQGFFALPYTILIYPWPSSRFRACGWSRTGAATSRRPTSCAGASARARWRPRWRPRGCW